MECSTNNRYYLAKYFLGKILFEDHYALKQRSISFKGLCCITGGKLSRKTASVEGQKECQSERIGGEIEIKLKMG